MSRIFDYPEIPMSIASGLVFAVIVAIGIIAGKRFLHARVHGQGPANDVVNTTLTIFSLFYGILLGLLVVGAYDNVNEVDNILAKEAAAVTVLFWDAKDFPEPTRTELVQSLRAYAQQVVNNSLAEQAEGIRPASEGPLVGNLMHLVNAFEPQTKSQESLQNEMRRNVSGLLEARSTRLSNSDIGIPPVLWWIVGLGAAITLVLICLLDYPLKVHLIFGCLLAFFIGAVIFVIASLDYPFSGANHVSLPVPAHIIDSMGG